MAKTLPTAAAVAAVTGKGQPSSKTKSTASRTTRRRKYSGQDDHRRMESNGTITSGKENEDNISDEAVNFLSPSPNKNKKNRMVSAPKKKKKLLRTTHSGHTHHHPSHDPMTYFQTTTPSSSSTDATMVLMELPPCTALLDFNSKKEYLDLATPRVLLDQFEKDVTASCSSSSLSVLEGTKEV